MLDDRKRDAGWKINIPSPDALEGGMQVADEMAMARK